jgi:hypothetical protein
MYAMNSPSDIYHALAEDDEYTLCGLSVVPVIINRPARTAALHLTSQKPAGRSLCEACAKSKRTNEGSDTPA